MAVLTYLEAIRLAMLEEMQRDPRVFVIGEDVGTYGGAFRVTAGFLDTFGEKRVIDTPISETAIVGAAIGASLMGMRPIAEMQFIDFISCAFDMLVNYAAKSRYRWGAGVPIVVRGPCGGGVHGGPFHSQNPEAYFMNVPGLKIVAPATPTDAKGLLTAAIRDPDPVIYLEHKFLYRRIKEEVPDGEVVTPIGKARVARVGRDVSIITYAAMLHVALEAAEAAARDGIDVEVVDLRTLLPLDEEAILAHRGQDRQGDRAPRGHAHRRTRGRDRGAHRRAGLRVPRRAGGADRRPGHAGPLLAAPRGHLPAERREGRPGHPRARGLLMTRIRTTAPAVRRIDHD